MDKFPSNQIVKIGIVVEDIEAAVKEYAALFDIDPPEVHHPKPRVKEPGGKEPYTVFRGKSEQARCKTAIVRLEPIYIELIEPLDEPSPWNEFKQAHGQGVHYVAFESPSGFGEVEKLMEGRGMPIYHKTEKGTQRYGYFETAEKLGVTLEFKEID